MEVVTQLGVEGQDLRVPLEIPRDFVGRGVKTPSLRREA